MKIKAIEDRIILAITNGDVVLLGMVQNNGSEMSSSCCLGRWLKYSAIDLYTVLRARVRLTAFDRASCVFFTAATSDD